MRSKTVQNKKELYLLIGIFFLSFILRLIYLLQVKSNPFFNSPIMDALYHDLWAQSISQGNWIGDHVFFRAPFYPYFLGTIYKLFGHNYFMPRLIQHLIGSFSVVLIYFLAKKLFNLKVAILSAIFASIYWLFIYFEGEFLLDSLLVFFGVLLVLTLNGASENPKRLRFFSAGVIAGLFALTRPNLLIFIPFILLWIFLLLKLELKKKFVFSFFFLFGMLLLIFPVTLRNYLVGKDFVLIASQGGINFYIGNNAEANGLSAFLPPFGDEWDYPDAFYEVEKAMNKIPKPSEVSDYYFKKGMDFIIYSPQEFFFLFVKKLYFFWNAFEPTDIQNIYYFKRYSVLIRILPLGFWLISPLSLLGIVFSLKNWRKLFLPMSFIFSYTLSLLLFFVTSRFRLPVLPFLLILSAYALFKVFDFIRNGSFKKLSLALILFLFFFFLTASNLYHLDKGNFAQAHLNLGNLFLRKGEYQNAKEQLLLALGKNPLIKRAHLILGEIYFYAGDYSSAEKEFLEELKLSPQEEKAFNKLSYIYRIKRNYPEAIRQAKNAIKIKPYYIDANLSLFLTYLEEENFNLAESTLANISTSLYPPPAGMRFYQGLLYQAQGKLKEALEEYELLLSEKNQTQEQKYNIEHIFSKDEPTPGGLMGLKAYAAYNSGVIYIKMKELDLAQKSLILSFKLKPDLAEAHAALGHLYELKNEYQLSIKEFEETIKISPNNPEYHYNLGLIYAKSENLLSAKQELQIALKLLPEFENAQVMLKLVDSLLSVYPSK